MRMQDAASAVSSRAEYANVLRALTTEMVVVMVEVGVAISKSSDQESKIGTWWWH